MVGLALGVFSFRGRISRWGYWKYSLLNLIAGFGALCLISFLACLYMDSAAEPLPVVVDIAFALLIVALIVPSWIGLALQVRRLHDRGMTGWLVLAGLVPVLGFLWLLFETYIRRGRVEANRFGPPETAGKKLTARAGLGFGAALATALILILAGRSLVMEPFNIPTEGNAPTLLNGDFVLVVKTAYLLRKPRQGEMAVFINPHTGAYYIKRIVALGGDTVQMTNGVLVVNGQPWKRVRIADYHVCDQDEAFQRPVNEWRYHYVETAPGGAAHDILGNVTAPERFTSCLGMPPEPPAADSRPEDAMAVDNTPVFAVPADHFFAVGDNRDNSADSRLGLGTVPVANLLGPVELTYFSSAGWLDLGLWKIPTSIRWARFPSVVR